MKKENMQAYSKRITQANRSELIVIMYEILIEHVSNAQLSYGNVEEFNSDIDQAQAFLKELMVSLDFAYKISYDLLSIYIFINKTFIEAKQKNSCEMLPRVQGMLENLLSSFREVGNQDHSEPLMQNTQKVYAGLTYGRNDVNEMAIASNLKNRGFQA